MSDIEITPEGSLVKPLDAFPRQTAPVATPPVTPATVEKTPETPVSTTEVPPTTETPPATEVPPVVTPPVVQPPKETTTPANEPDYRKKFGESTRQNQILASQYAELQKVLGDITKEEVPTDDEMVALIGKEEWDYMSDREKNNERRLHVLEKREQKRTFEFNRLEAERETLNQLNTYIESEPRLKGKENEFYEFATKPSNKGASMEVLLQAFLFETTPIVTPDPTPVVEETPPALERGNPSGNMPPVQTGKTEKTAEELKLLRTTDPRKYNDMVRKGQI